MGVGIQRIGVDDLLKIDIHLPSIDEQRKIVELKKKELLLAEESKLIDLRNQIGLEQADQNSFLRHKIAGPLRNMKGSLKKLNEVIIDKIMPNYPNVLSEYLNDSDTTLEQYLYRLERDLTKVSRLAIQSREYYSI